MERKCPDCKKEMHYKDAPSFKRACLKNTLCKSCNGKGHKNGFYQKTHTQEVKDHLREINIGNCLSTETKQKISKTVKLADRCVNKRSNYFYWVERFGEDEAIRLLEKSKATLSIRFSGENNPMYGKPSPQGSGNGWCGWYKDWHFRSLKELSFMINLIERFNLKWEKGEQITYRIDYIDFLNSKHTYHPDFIINDKFMVEIKPKHLWNSDIVKRKQNAAEIWCKNHGMKYKLMDAQSIKINDLKKLIEENKVELTDRYKEKLKNYE